MKSRLIRLVAVVVALSVNVACAHAQAIAPASGSGLKPTSATASPAGAPAPSNPALVAPPSSLTVKKYVSDPETGNLTYVMDLPDPLSAASYTVNKKGEMVKFTVSLKNGDAVASTNLSKEEWSKFFKDNVTLIDHATQSSPVKLILRSLGKKEIEYRIAATLKVGGEAIYVVNVEGKDSDGEQIPASAFAFQPPKTETFYIGTSGTEGSKLYPVQVMMITKVDPNSRKETKVAQPVIMVEVVESK